MLTILKMRIIIERGKCFGQFLKTLASFLHNPRKVKRLFGLAAKSEGFFLQGLLKAARIILFKENAYG